MRCDDQFLGVIGIADLLAAIVTARMSGDEFFVVKEQQLVGVELEGEFLRGVEVGHRVAIGVEDDVATTVGADGSDDGAVVGHDRQWLEPGFLLGEQVDGFAVGLAMNADVGDGVPPLGGGGIDGGEGRDVQAVEEVLLHVADAVFHAPFGLDCELHPISTSAGNNFG